MIYDIKIAERNNARNIQFFIDIHWKKNHALAISKKLFDFQHFNSINSQYNYIIAVNNITNEIDALIGFIPTSQYDSSLLENGDYWGAIWKVRNDIENNEIKDIGLLLWKKLLEFDGFNSFGAIGISKIAKKIYALSGLTTGNLNHYFMINGDKINFKIAVIKDDFKTISDIEINRDYHFDIIDINDFNENSIHCTYRPKKSVTYLKNRYSKHPIYNYDFIGLFEQSQLISIWVTRLIEINESKVLRIVDVYGNIENLPDLTPLLQGILVKTDCEYIDILNYGIDEKVFLNIGFNKLNFDGDVIIPNYFEPFEQRNVIIEIAYKADYEYVVFKGDSDQDRPNIL
jgi:hypothetical protein